MLIQYIIIASFLCLIFLPLGILAEEGMKSPIAYEEYQKKLTDLQESQDKPSPRQQMASGIEYVDVMCSGNFVVLLKWSGNTLACVKPQSVEKLVERGWGIPKDQTIFPGYSSECETSFIIHYDDPTLHNESKIIKTIRNALSQVDLTLLFGEYTYRWEYVTVSEPNSESKTTIIVEGIYRDGENELEKKEYNMIIESINDLNEVDNVEPRRAWCR